MSMLGWQNGGFQRYRLETKGQDDSKYFSRYNPKLSGGADASLIYDLSSRTLETEKNRVNVLPDFIIELPYNRHMCESC
jgi:hypothetical protein